MTTYTTSGITFPTDSTTLTLQNGSRSVTITAREYMRLRDLFDLFEAAIISMGFVRESYQDLIFEIAKEIEIEAKTALEIARRRMTAEQDSGNDETDDNA